MSKPTRADAAPFAHLMGRPAAPAAARAEEDDERKKRDGESDEEHAKRLKALDEEDARRAEEDGEPKDPEEEPEDQDAKKASEPRDDDGDDDADEKDKKGRKAERARTARVLGHAAAAGRVAQAAMLLTTTGLSSRQITGILAASPSQSEHVPLGRRMSAQPIPPVGSGPAPRTAAIAIDKRGIPNAPDAGALAAAIAAAGKKARGEA